MSNPTSLSPERAAEVKESMIAQFPPKVRRKRAKHIQVTDPSASPEIEANVRTVPGIITQRGCTYAGCKGVILGPTRDVLSITHGPIGCGYYSWLTRRNQTRTPNEEAENFITYSLSTDMQEENIVFGGEKKLKQAIQEAYDHFTPKAIAIHSTCPVGLIGDDVHSVSKDMSEELGINVFGFSCEGYRGVSQSAGHHIANNKIFEKVVSHEAGVDHFPVPDAPFRFNLLGEYNIGGDAFVLEALFEQMGVNLVATFSGNSTYEQFANARHVDLNLVMCHRSINYVAEMLESAYGIPWLKVNFIGADQTAKSLRKLAKYFGDEGVQERTEKLVTEELAKLEPIKEAIKKRCEGKKVMLFVGGSRAHSYQHLFREIGVEVVAAGYEFGHRDDYEGRKVIPDIKIDADSRNIEELHIEKSEEHYKERVTDEIKARFEEGDGFAEYEGMMPDMPEGMLSIDDVSQFEVDKLIEELQPDMVCCGIKEKYNIQKHGIPSRQIHSYDYGGPYAGFEGAVNFWKDVDRMMHSKVWKLTKAPWQLVDAE